jgi:hypothetical protein
MGGVSQWVSKIPLQTGVFSWLILGNALSWTQVVGLMPQCTFT